MKYDSFPSNERRNYHGTLGLYTSLKEVLLGSINAGGTDN